ncbi:MAG: LicD family protein [Lachnospiraceae bacterium]|nr:LicD family protein [Lachnospiraceae bacterium]
MAGTYNGQYDVEDKGMFASHLEALELLGILHDICIEKGYKYSLVDDTLTLYVEKKPFSIAEPGISLIVEYGTYCKLVEDVKRYVELNNSYVFVNYENANQYDNICFWLAKKNRVNLPIERKQDEIYYYTHVTVLPVFFVSDYFVKRTKAYKIMTKTMRCLHSRKLTSQVPIFRRIRFAKRRMLSRYYRKRRDKVSIALLEQQLAELHGDYKKGFYMGNPLVKRCEIEEVELVKFEGQPCYVSKHAVKMVDRYSKKFKDGITKNRKADLLLKGGETLRRVQYIQLELLKEFDAVCRKHGLRYNIAFGTLLGAVRHGGFIPWDDDIDVLMPIEDYLKLDKAIQEEIDSDKYFLRTIDSEPDNNLTYKRLVRKGTVYASPGREHMKAQYAVCMDILPVFHQTNNRFYHWIQTKICRFYRRATWAHAGADAIKKPLRRAWYMQVRKKGNRKNYQLFMKWAMSSRCTNQFYSYFHAPVRSPYRAYFLSEEAFNDTIEIEFEGYKFLAPKDCNRALNYVYGGDYMLYPSRLSGRKPEHLVVVEIGDLYSYD